MSEEKFYTVDEIAVILKVNPMTIYRWIKTNKLISLKAGKQYRVKKEDLDNFLNNKKNKI